MLDKISQFINSLPDYIGQGILGIIVTVVTGLVLGYITSKYFTRKDELTRIEGLLLEKKIPIYKEIFKRLESLNNQVEYTPANCSMALQIMQECEIKRPKYLHSSQILENSDEMRETFLAIDQYATENKIFFDDDVASAMLVFQNYIIAFVRFQAMFREQMEQFGVTMSKEICNVEHQMMIALGLILSEDLFQQTQKVTTTIRNSLNNLSFNHRVAPTYRYEDFNDPESTIFKELLQTKAFAEREKIITLITHFVSIGLLAGKKYK